MNDTEEIRSTKPATASDHHTLVNTIDSHYSLRRWPALEEYGSEDELRTAQLRLRLTSSEVYDLIKALEVAGPLVDRLMSVSSEDAELVADEARLATA